MSNASEPKSGVGSTLGAAAAMMVRQILKLPSWALLLFLVIGASLLVRFFVRSAERPEADQANQPTETEQRPISATNPASQAGSQVTPADTFAQTLRETLRPKYHDIDVGTVNHVLSLVSDSFRNDVRRDSQAKELLKKRSSLCAIEIWTVAVGYSSDVSSNESMDVTSLRCPEEKTARDQELAPRKKQLAAELSDPNLHVSASGDTLIFDSELFSGFDARDAFLQQIGGLSYKKLFCELQFTQIELKYQSRTMRTVPIVCK